MHAGRATFEAEERRLGTRSRDYTNPVPVAQSHPSTLSSSLPTHNLSSVVREAEWLSGRPAGHGWMDGLDGPTHEKWAIFHLEMNKRQKNIDPPFVRQWNRLRVGGSGDGYFETLEKRH